jgi:hypothetical protein
MKNLRVLRALCGEHYFQNIVLVTSMWTVAPVEEMDEQVGREVQFNSAAEFWGDIIDKGATYCRWDDTRAIVPSKSAAEIVEMRENRNEAPKLGVLLEVEKGIKIESTQAYQVLTEELRKKQERERRAARMNEEEMNQLRSQKENLEVIAGKEEEDFRRELDDLKRIEGATQGGFGSSSREGGRFTFRNPFTSLARPHRRFSEGAALPRPSDSRQYQETGERDGTRGESIQTRSGWDNMRDGRVSRNERERNYESGPERPERRRGGRRSRGSEYKLVLVKRKR